MAYKEEDFLQLSGIQHFCFCRRQWALIHIEQQWAENFWTTDGKIMHGHAHDAGFRESRGDCIITRGMKIQSQELGISGECDVIEFWKDAGGITLKEKEGLWKPYPIEYKRGKQGSHTHADELQLCAQAMCLEEMLCCEIKEGALYYGEVRRRQQVEFTEEMRCEVKACVKEMHDLYQKGYTPRVNQTKLKQSKVCRSCSLMDVCIPGLRKKQSVTEYIRAHLGEME